MAAKPVSREVMILSVIAPDTQCVIRANWNYSTNKASWAKDDNQGLGKSCKGWRVGVELLCTCECNGRKQLYINCHDTRFRLWIQVWR